jgi:hypothetical protein
VAEEFGVINIIFRTQSHSEEGQSLGWLLLLPSSAAAPASKERPQKEPSAHTCTALPCLHIVHRIRRIACQQLIC